VIGNGDHGVTISKGMASAIIKVEEIKPTNISNLLKIFGNKVVATIGGVSGPIFGAIFPKWVKKLIQ